MRIGIIGAGQLGQMLGHAARDLGYDCCFVDPAEAPPAAGVGRVIRARFDDETALRQLANFADVITYEFENVPVTALRAIEDTINIYPPPDALARAQDRLAEKRLFDALRIPLPGYRRVDSRADIDRAAADLGLPLVVKTRRFGYDGKGQVVIRRASDVDDAWPAFDGKPAIAEAWVDFDFEVSIIGARNPDGDVVTWSLTANEHVNGILHTSRAPCEAEALTETANRYVVRLLEHLDYVGVLALEMFVVGDTLLANEYAPRVHNSGHWTIEGAESSQFLNHLLTITGRGARSTTNRGHAGMFNLVGTIPDAVRKLADCGFYLHDYGKTPRPGRKLGHVTVVAPTAAERDARLAEIVRTAAESHPL